MPLSRERLLDRLVCNPATGNFVWRDGQCAGRSAGSRLKSGYHQIGLDGKVYDRGQLVWLYVTGALPSPGMEVTHRNGTRNDDRWENLRLQTIQEKVVRQRRSDNKSGHRGVSWDKKREKWLVCCIADGVHHFVGRFSRIDDAIAARAVAAGRLHGAQKGGVR